MKRHLALILTLSATAAAPSVLGQELVRNGTFDRDLSSWGGSRPNPQYGVSAPSWIPGDDARGDARSGSARTGWFCSSIHPWCFQQWLNQCIPVRPGGSYRLSVNEHGSSAGVVSAEWYSSPDCTTGDLGAAGGATLRSEAWSRWESLASAPPDARSMWLTLMAPAEAPTFGAGGGVIWDDVSLQVISEPAAVSRDLLIPTAANSDSLFGAVFKTRLTLLSLGSSRPAPVHLQVLPRGSEAAPSKTIVLLPGVPLTLDDALGGLSYEGGAAILVTHAEDQPLYAAAEVYTDSAGGRYTTPVPVLGDPAPERRVATPGISSTSTSRTNVGCANVGETGRGVDAEVHAADGSKLGTVTLLTRSKGWVQEPVPFPVSGGYILWGNAEGMTGPPTGVTCFAVVVDNATNDGSLIR